MANSEKSLPPESPKRTKAKPLKIGGKIYGSDMIPWKKGYSDLPPRRQETVREGQSSMKVLAKRFNRSQDRRENADFRPRNFGY